jgi:xanthine dehydrogenase accessory factor
VGAPPNIYQRVAECLAAGEAVAIATVVRTRGSSPREAGARMLVHSSGQIEGTVGGGCGEEEVRRAALTTITSRQPRLIEVDLTEPVAMDTDGVCGGARSRRIGVRPDRAQRERSIRSPS